MNTTDSLVWRIVDIKAETPTVSSLYLEAVNNERPGFIAGQYLTIKIPNLGPAEGKAYSISSDPFETLVRVSVKKMGTFSTGILNHKIGDTITTSLPYGFFYPEPSDQTDLIFVVGGIGIAPCLSIIKHLINIGDSRTIKLFYSNQTKADITFETELNTLAENNPLFTVNYYLTRETIADDNYQLGRFTPSDIITKLNNQTGCEIFICGSMNFTKDLWRGFRDAGIPPYQIYTEGFF